MQGKKFIMAAICLALALGASGSRAAQAASGEVSVGSLQELLSALDDSGVSTIVVTEQIEISGEDIDGRGKTIRVEVPGRTDTEINANSSKYSVFINSGIASLCNMAIIGGSDVAIFNDCGSRLTLDGVTVTGVYAIRSHGGALRNFGLAYVKNCVFRGNVADAGGAFFVDKPDALLVMENTACIENVAYAGGGGAGQVSNNAELYCNNVTFANNQTMEYGGAINGYMAKKIYLQNCTMVGNLSLFYTSAALDCRDTETLEAVNCLFGANYYCNKNSDAWLTCDARLANSHGTMKSCAYADVQGLAGTTLETVINADSVFHAMTSDAVVNFKNNITFPNVERPKIVDESIRLQESANLSGCVTYWQVDPVDLTVVTGDTAPQVENYPDGTARPSGSIGSSRVEGKIYYRIQTAVNDPDLGAAVGDGGLVEATTVIALTAVPNSWYSRFEGWSDENGLILSTEPEYVFTPNRNLNLTANFALNDNRNFNLLSQPQAQEVHVGQPAAFSVAAQGTARYQWYFAPLNGQPVALTGETGENLTVSPRHNSSFYHDGARFYCEIECVSSTEARPITTSVIRTSTAGLGLYYQVSLPGGEGYEAAPSAGAGTAVRVGESFSFVVLLSDGYNGRQMSVAANGQPLTAIDGIYTVAAVESDLSITVSGVQETLGQICLLALPNKTSYLPGEHFDPSGMQVQAVYKAGSVKDVTSLCSWEEAALVAGQAEVYISYTEDGETYTAVCPVEVADVVPDISPAGKWYVWPAVFLLVLGGCAVAFVVFFKKRRRKQQ